jgi:hypothetical protein
MWIYAYNIYRSYTLPDTRLTMCALSKRSEGRQSVHAAAYTVHDCHEAIKCRLQTRIKLLS